MSNIKDSTSVVPFDLYDFFGYLFPGVLFISNMTLLIYEIDSKTFDKYYNLFFRPEGNFFLIFTLVVASIIFSYTIGHLIAAISHLIIDRVLMDGVEGYPMSYVLGLEKKERYFLSGTFKIIFLFFNLYLITPIIIKEDWKNCLLYLWLAIIVILIVSRAYIMKKREKLKDTNTEEIQKIVNNKAFQIIKKGFWDPIIYFTDFIIGFLRRLTGIDRIFKENIAKLFKNNFEARYGIKVEEAESDSYWLPYLLGVAQNQIYQKMLNNWLYLYAFARNTSAACYLSLFLIVTFSLKNQSINLNKIELHLIILWIAATLFGLRYWILYSHYYTKAVARIFIEALAEKGKLKKLNDN